MKNGVVLKVLNKALLLFIKSLLFATCFPNAKFARLFKLSCAFFATVSVGTIVALYGSKLGFAFVYVQRASNSFCVVESLHEVL